MNKFKLLMLSIFGTFLLSTYANAAIVVDQNQADNTVYMAAFSQADLAQSFQQSHDNISGAGIFLQSGIGNSNTVTISLFDALPNNNGTLLASSTGVGTQGSWFDVFWSPVVVNPLDTYYLVFSGNTTLGIGGSLNNPYPNGNVFANAGYIPFSTYDYAFRTYYDNNFSSVPEPTTIA